MIKTLKCATNLPELLFLCREHGVLPILIDSVPLGLDLARKLNEQYPQANLALLDSDTLLEVVSYDTEEELRQYYKNRDFACAFMVNKDGCGVPLEC